jgi:hypothetical protein
VGQLIYGDVDSDSREFPPYAAADIFARVVNEDSIEFFALVMMMIGFAFDV